MMKIFYRRFIPHINNSIDFAELLSEMLGELNVSHTGARRINRNRNGDNTASLGVFYNTEYKGDGLKILEIIEGSPLKTKKSKIKSGTIIEKIDGIKILKNKNYYSLLNRKSGKNILLSLYNPISKDRWEERVKPISRRIESRLLYKRWIKRNRVLTDKLSNGRLGYVHVSSMSDSSYRTVIEEVLGKYVNKEAIIIDTRFNGGGDLVDDLTNFLSGKRYMDFIPPNNKVIGFEPQMRWTKPSIVIASEGNYSDAHCFAWAYKKMELGKVIGMPVAGTCTFVWWETLMNRNVYFGIPNMGIKDDRGNYLENCQLEPDIKIDNTPEDLVKGKDIQLETAINILLKDINNGGKND
jgi:C-terminal processing protease CtpA/Prc